MPETYFRVRWPDGQEQNCYSPSSIVTDFFKSNTEYDLAEFVSISERALAEASERVKQKYGFYCSSATDQFKQIQLIAARFDKADSVTVLKIYSE